MSVPDDEWESRLRAAWASLDGDGDGDDGTAFVRRIDALAGELPGDDAVAAFERASARDSTGRPELAVPLYEAALDTGLSGERRRRAVIQLASSIRSLGDPQRAVSLLEAELLGAHDALTGAVGTFLALALADAGREREAVGVAVTALSEYLPRYNRSTARYAADLLRPDAPDAGRE